MYRLIALLIGYLIGTIQTAYFIGKLHGIDIREHGSKNAGMTNVARTLGGKAGAFVFIVDMLKGMAAFFITALIFINQDLIVVGIYAVLGTILGHCFPVWLKFRGGKGVACFLLLPFMVDWRVGCIALAIGVAVLIPTRYISFASLVYTLLTVILMVIFKHSMEAVILMAVITALIWFLHRENIKRLLNGTERKFFSKKQN